MELLRWSIAKWRFDSSRLLILSTMIEIFYVMKNNTNMLLMIKSFCFASIRNSFEKHFIWCLMNFFHSSLLHQVVSVYPWEFFWPYLPRIQLNWFACSCIPFFFTRLCITPIQSLSSFFHLFDLSVLATSKSSSHLTFWLLLGFYSMLTTFIYLKRNLALLCSMMLMLWSLGRKGQQWKIFVSGPFHLFVALLAYRRFACSFSQVNFLRTPKENTIYLFRSFSPPISPFSAWYFDIHKNISFLIALERIYSIVLVMKLLLFI